MKKNNYTGKFIVFEGIDGSGKSTQAKLLVKKLAEEGYKVATIDFPQYGTKSAGLVDEYLNGKYGSAKEVGPYRASIFFACDRYDASFKIRGWLNEDFFVVSDRYIGSNIGHQGGKIKDKKERRKYLKWLFNLEYKIFGIPKPDITFLLKVPLGISQKMTGKITDEAKKAKKKLYLGDKKSDIHDGDLDHLKNAEASYLDAAREFPKEFIVIDCMKSGKLLSPELINKEVWKFVKKII